MEEIERARPPHRRRGPCGSRRRARPGSPARGPVPGPSARRGPRANRASSADLHWSASAPWPTAGTMLPKPSAWNSRPGQDAIPRRLSPAAARIVPSATRRSAIFLRRVSTLPRISTNPSPGKSIAAWWRRLGLPVASVLGDADARAQDEHVARVLAGQVARGRKPRDGLAGQVLRAVDREVRLPPEERRLELACEEPLAPLLLERPLRLPVARRDELEQLALGAEAARAGTPRPAPPGRAQAGSFGSRGRVCFPFARRPGRRMRGGQYAAWTPFRFFLDIQGIMLRSRWPTFSILWAAPFFRSLLYFLRPPLYSATHCARELARSGSP